MTLVDKRQELFKFLTFHNTTKHASYMGFLKSIIKKKEKALNLNIKADQNCPPATILYGTKTGNAQMIAQQANKYFHQCGIESECINMDKYDAGRLPSENNLLIVVSTDGEGELPPNARKFFSLLQHEEMPLLPDLKYAICALGDSSYDHFCGAGKTIDEQLKKLNAKAIINRVDCDLDFKKSAMQWIQQSYDTIAGVKKDTPQTEELSITEPEFISSRLVKRYQLTKEDVEQPVFHVEIDNSQKVEYAPGDCIEIIPNNPQTLVNRILEILNIDKDQHLVTYNQSIGYLLLHKFELTKLARPVLRRHIKITNNKALQELYSNRDKLRDYLNSSDVLDLLKDYPANLDADEFISILNPLHSRYYSIASGAKAKPDQIDLTVKTIRFQQKERQYEGAGSTFVNEYLQEGTNIDYRLVSNPSFHLPEQAETPVIMIGVGTGIAPYRAFLQDMETAGIKNKAWLIWGDKHQASDFLYEDELLKFHQNETLAHLNTAFSRDQENKEYVQHRLVDNKERLMDWLDNGAIVYLCGHNKMGDEIKRILCDLYQSEKGMSEQQAKSHLRQQRDNGIIREDLY